MNQRNGVYAAICAVLGTIPSQSQPVELTPSQKKEAIDRIVYGLCTGEIEYKGGPPTPEVAAKYVPGLLNNWMRKDKRLNGNTDYVAKNPGSRTGAGDEQLKNLKALLAIHKDPEIRKQVQAAIDQRTEEMKPKFAIDLNNLPEHLRQFAPANLVKAVPPTIRRAEQEQ